MTTMFVDRPYTPDIEKANKFYSYEVVTIDLSTARTNAVYELSGNFLGIQDLTAGATLNISFDRANADLVFSGEEHVYIKFSRLFLTNTAQAGCSVKLFVGRGVYRIPFYRTKAIPPAMTLLKSYVHSVTSAASALSASYATDFVGYVIGRIELFNNSGETIYIGGSGVTTANGFPVFSGQAFTINAIPGYISASPYVIKAGAAVSLNMLVWGNS